MQSYLADLSARAFAQKLEERTKQAVIADNRPGAGGIIGAEYAAKQPPDGYTLMIGAQQWMAILPSLKSDLPYDPVKDFVPVAQMVRAPLILVVHPSVPATTVADLVALAKAQPGKLTYGTPGLGTSMHLLTDTAAGQLGIELVHVPYKGASELVRALITGETMITADTAGAIQPQVAAGKAPATALSAPSSASSPITV